MWRRMGRGWARAGAGNQQEQEGSPSICPMSAPDPDSSERLKCWEEEESTGEVLGAGGAVGAQVSTKEPLSSRERWHQRLGEERGRGGPRQDRDTTQSRQSKA